MSDRKNQNGLGDAVKCSQKHIDDEPFAVLLGYTLTKGPLPCTKHLINIYKKYRKSAVGLQKFQEKKHQDTESSKERKSKTTSTKSLTIQSASKTQNLARTLQLWVAAY